MRVTASGRTFDQPIESTIGAVAGFAENATITDTDSVWVEQTLTKKKVARLVKSSRELLDDVAAAFSLVTTLSTQASRKFSVYNDLQSAQDGDGTGTNYTEALVQATITEIATGIGAALTRDIILSTYFGLPSEYRDGTEAVWMANGATVEFISKLEDGNGRPLYLAADAPAVPVADVGNAVGVVEGLPLLEVPFTADILMVGLLMEGHMVLDDGVIRVEATTEGAGTFENDQVAWKFVQRRDSAVVLEDAFRKSQTVIAPV